MSENLNSDYRDNNSFLSGKSGGERMLKLSGLERIIITPESNLINVGEHTNVAGSKKNCEAHQWRTI